MENTLRLLGGILAAALIALLTSSCQTIESLGGEDAPAYRVQVHLTDDRAEAEIVRDQAASWWTALRPEERPPGAADNLTAVVVWQQPYYRVRLGAFRSRDAAADVLPTIRAEFPEAFIVRAQRDA
ncbi:MAG: hypothetical protein GVY12_07825 [Bacteroidetes bacterium]|jgi:hypothetical protein|nr:hypothetical protein [Bacteroidota bacterium]